MAYTYPTSTLPVNEYIPATWQDQAVYDSNNTPTLHVKFLIDIAKVTGLLNIGGDGLPDQTNNQNKLLSTNGTNPFWSLITDFPSITALTGSESLLTSQNNTHKNITLSNIKSYVLQGSSVNIILTTIGNSGIATYDINTGTLNIPNYTSGSSTSPIFVPKERPTGLKNGINNTFTLLFIPILKTEHIFVNGILQEEYDDYNIVNNIITFVNGAIPEADDKLRISYFKQYINANN